MKKKLCVMVLAVFALTACQDKQPAPAQSSSSATTPVAAAEKSMPVEKAQPATANANAVAVTKAPVSSTAKRMHEAAMQAHVAMASQLQALKTAVPATSTAADKSPAPKKTTPVKKTMQQAAATPATAKDIAIKAKAAVTAPVHQAVTAAAPAKIAEKVTPAAPVQAVAMLGNATRGKSIARKCQACHRFTDKRKVGPGLKGIVGRQAGIMPDMKYSPALKAGGWVWTIQALSAWDCDSKKAVKVLSGNPAAKTKMPAQHICDPTKQADLMAFLKTL